ncbi:hypothetical protein BDZ97DRAFT_1920300 [Flammula alnicola]|nr:hypothetical protein BDZ97DRAFT_1920300 [Flammula alnicola]
MSQLGQEVYDLSGFSHPSLSFRSPVSQINSKEASAKLPSAISVTYRRQKTKNGLKAVPFPKGTTGVLYIHLPSGYPDISAQIRFRICHTLAGFNEGRDLCHDITGEPWNVSLYSIVRFPVYSVFSQMLLEEGLIDVDLISDIRNLPLLRAIRSSCLYALNQPFNLDLALDTLYLCLMTRSSLERIRMNHILRHQCLAKGIWQAPYTGRVRARFELSTLPEHVELGPTLLLRFVDIIKPA